MKSNIKKIIALLSISLIVTACSTNAKNNTKLVEEKETKKETLIETKKEINKDILNKWFQNLIKFPHGTTGSSLRAVKLLDESLNLQDYSDQTINYVNKLYENSEKKSDLNMTISLLFENIKKFKSNPSEYKKSHEDAGAKFTNEKNINDLEKLVNSLYELSKKENNSKENEKNSSLSNLEKENINKFVTELEKIPNGTAGSGLQIIGTFYDSLNYASVFEEKPNLSINYINSLIPNLEKKNNFKMSLDALKFQIKEYKKDKQDYINSNKDSGYTWNPSISIEAYENVINNINVQ